MHVTDWLPTILSAAKYDMDKLPLKLDGMDFWQVLSTKEASSPRTDFLYNIDKKTKNSALRIWNWKIIEGHTYGGAWDGWYPPWQLENAGRDLGENHTYMDGNLNDVAVEPAPSALFNTDLPSILQKSLQRDVHSGSPVVVKCGQRPPNATTNCQPTKAPCLFDLDSDPCEFNNVAARRPEVVESMMQRLDLYSKTAVPPRNKPQDPKGLPANNHGAWVPWVTLNSTRARDVL